MSTKPEALDTYIEVVLFIGVEFYAELQVQYGRKCSIIILQYGCRCNFRFRSNALVFVMLF